MEEIKQQLQVKQQNSKQLKFFRPHHHIKQKKHQKSLSNTPQKLLKDYFSEIPSQSPFKNKKKSLNSLLPKQNSANIHINNNIYSQIQRSSSSSKERRELFMKINNQQKLQQNNQEQQQQKSTNYDENSLLKNKKLVRIQQSESKYNFQPLILGQQPQNGNSKLQKNKLKQVNFPQFHSINYQNSPQSNVDFSSPQSMYFKKTAPTNSNNDSQNCSKIYQDFLTPKRKNSYQYQYQFKPTINENQNQQQSPQQQQIQNQQQQPQQQQFHHKSFNRYNNSKKKLKSLNNLEENSDKIVNLHNDSQHQFQNESLFHYKSPNQNKNYLNNNKHTQSQQLLQSSKSQPKIYPIIYSDLGFKKKIEQIQIHQKKLIQQQQQQQQQQQLETSDQQKGQHKIQFDMQFIKNQNFDIPPFSPKKSQQGSDQKLSQNKYEIQQQQQSIIKQLKKERSQQHLKSQNSHKRVRKNNSEHIINQPEQQPAQQSQHQVQQLPPQNNQSSQSQINIDQIYKCRFDNNSSYFFNQQTQSFQKIHQLTNNNNNNLQWMLK